MIRDESHAFLAPRGLAELSQVLDSGLAPSLVSSHLVGEVVIGSPEVERVHTGIAQLQLHQEQERYVILHLNEVRAQV